MEVSLELAVLVNDFTPVINELWPRLEDHKYLWELHSYGLPEGICVAHNKLLQAHTKADHHKPGGSGALRSSATSFRSV